MFYAIYNNVFTVKHWEQNKIDLCTRVCSNLSIPDRYLTVIDIKIRFKLSKYV